jgi:hypothetical protein
MPRQYWKESILSLGESKLQDFLTEGYENMGWHVKNMHRTDPRSENGADLVVRRNSEMILVAIKDKPAKGDIDQLRRLWERRKEASLVYAYSKPSTGPFSVEEKRLSNDIKFLKEKELHDFLIKGESISYLQSIFELHPLVQEYSRAMTIVWEERNVRAPLEFPKEGKLNLYLLKSTLLKKRVGVSVFSTKFDDYANSLISKNPDKFTEILDEVVDNLDIVQRVAGASLYESFVEVASTEPYLFSMLWEIVSQRTYWIDYTSATKQMSKADEVSEFTAKYWVLPGKNAIGEAKSLSENAIGFLSAVDDILKSLAYAFRELDVAIDWLFHSY